MRELIDSIGDDGNLSDNDKILPMTKVLKLKGQYTFDLDDNQAFALFVGNTCNTCFIKNKQPNARPSCNRCIYKKYNDK